jgi:hypothetical protein
MENFDGDAEDGKRLISSTPDNARKIVTLKRRGNLPGKDSCDAIASSLGNRKRIDEHLPSENFRDRKKHEPSTEVEEWGWFVDVPFSPGSLPKGSLPKSGPIAPLEMHLVADINKKGTVPAPSDQVKKGDTDETSQARETSGPTAELSNENVIGKSNSLLRLWESMSMDRSTANLDPNEVPGNVVKAGQDRENLTRVTSFCFEMDI